MRSRLICFALTLAAALPLPAQIDSSAMAGISNHGQHLDQPYVTAGDRAYLIGIQDGNFPDLGGHVPGEMAGLWMHPIKLVDGFRARISDLVTGEHAELSESRELITYPYGSRFRYAPLLHGLAVERFQFSPDGRQGVVVRYTLTNATGRARRVELQLVVRPDLRPVWYSEHLGIEDGPDSLTWDPARRLFIARDMKHPWFCVWGAAPSTGAQPVADSAGASRHALSIAAHATETLTFIIAGSDRSESAALDAFTDLATHHARLLAAKRTRYSSIVERARIRIPDRKLQDVYDWVRINAQWLVRDVPGIGRGLGGGLMEYPWWFGTETYSLQALAASGDVMLAKEMLRLLRSQSEKVNGNGRIIHEVTTEGAVSNRGNTQETAQFIMTVDRVIRWSGDTAFAREMYPAMTAGLEWLLGPMDKNGDLFPEGYGITEILGLNAELIDVAVYTQQALESTARVARLLGDPGAAARDDSLATRLKERINQRFWLDDEHSYADFYGTRAQAVSAADGTIRQIGLKGADKLTSEDRELIERYRKMKEVFAGLPDTSRGWLTNRNWVITTPMEAAIAPPQRAIVALDWIREHAGPYGPYLSATDRQAMMTISTGVQAVSEANYGRSDNALWYMQRIVETFNRTSPGSISEMMPDYGCFVIAWTMYGIVVPLIQQFFGIVPDAPTKTITFDPHPPAGWYDMRIDRLPVGHNVISFSLRKTGAGIEYEVLGTESGWRYVFATNPKAQTGVRYLLNGKPVVPDSSGIRMVGLRNKLVVEDPARVEKRR
jgi:hypothetical protein